MEKRLRDRKAWIGHKEWYTPVTQLLVDNFELKQAMRELSITVNELKQENIQLTKKLHDGKDMNMENNDTTKTLMDSLENIGRRMSSLETKVESSSNKMEECYEDVNRLKRVWNRAIVSSQNKQDQGCQVSMTPSSSTNMTSVHKESTSTSSGSEESVGTTMTHDTGHDNQRVTQKPLSLEDVECLKERSNFSMAIDAWCPMKANTRQKLAGYDAITSSDFMDERTGVFTTPVGGEYLFSCSIQTAENVDRPRMILCRCDGKREVFGGGLEWLDHWWIAGPIKWNCSKDMALWVEMEPVKSSLDTNSNVRFNGGLTQCF